MTQLGCEKCMQRWAFCVLVLLVLTGLSFLLWYKLKHRDEDKARREAEEDEAGDVGVESDVHGERFVGAHGTGPAATVGDEIAKLCLFIEKCM